MTQFRDEQSFSVQVLTGYVGWHNRGNAMNWALIVHVASNGPPPHSVAIPHTDTMTLGTNRSRADRRRASRLAPEGM